MVNTRASDPTANLPWRVKFRLKRRNFEHSVRNLLLAIACRILGRKPKKIDQEKFRSECRKVLIIRTGKALGDAVMSLVLIPEARRLFHGCEVDLLLRDKLSDFFVQVSGANRVLVLYPKLLKAPLRTCKLLKHLRSNGYDLVIVCDNPYKSSFTTLLLSLFAKTRCVVGFENEESKNFLSISIKPERGVLMTKNLLKLLSPFGRISDNVLPHFIGGHLGISASDDVSSRSRLAIAPTTPDRVMIFIPNHWRKSSPVEVFLKSALALSVKGFHVSLAFGPGDHRDSSKEVISLLEDSKGLISVLPKLALIDFVNSIQSHSLFISNDCGPFHLAAATGTRVIGLFLTKEAQIDFGYHTKDIYSIYSGDLQEPIVEITKLATFLLSKVRNEEKVI